MFDIGFSEIALVFVIGLLVLGPERLPIAIKTVATWIKSFRQLASGMQHALSQELKINELQSEMKKLGESTKSVFNSNVHSELDELRKTIAELKQQINESSSSKHETNRDDPKTLFGVPVVNRVDEEDEDELHYQSLLESTDSRLPPIKTEGLNTETEIQSQNSTTDLDK